jgi:hypothetical protein
VKITATLIVFAALMLGCNNTEKKVPPGDQTRTYELNSNRDTINRIDMEGRKQGIWIKSNLHPTEPKDTVIYNDGVAVN